MTSFIGRLARATTRYRDDESGNVAILVRAQGVVLMLSIGAAVDIGRWLQCARSDRCGDRRRGARRRPSLQTNSQDELAAVAAAEKFYDENVTSRLPVVDDTVTFNVKSDGMGMKASGTAYIKTPFLRFAAIDKLPLLSTSQTDFGELQIAVGGNGGENIEVVDHARCHRLDVQHRARPEPRSHAPAPARSTP